MRTKMKKPRQWSNLARLQLLIQRNLRKHDSTNVERIFQALSNRPLSGFEQNNGPVEFSAAKLRFSQAGVFPGNGLLVDAGSANCAMSTDVPVQTAYNKNEDIKLRSTRELGCVIGAHVTPHQDSDRMNARTRAR